MKGYSIIVLLLLFGFESFSQKMGSVVDTIDNTKQSPMLLTKIIDELDSLRKINDSLLTANKGLASPVRFVEGEVSKEMNYLRNYTVYLALGVLGFGLILILAILFFLFHIEKGLGNYAFQSIGLIIVVVACLFLVVTGYDKDQITPIIGLLGTIVGFIFGSNLTSKMDPKRNADAPKADPLKKVE